VCLLESTPTYLKYLYKLIGIVQFSDSPSKCSNILLRLWCLPFYSYFVYLCVRYNTSYESNTAIFLYMHTVTNYVNIACVCLYVASFYNRSDKLYALLIKLDDVKVDTIMSMTSKSFRQSNWHKPILIGLLAFNILCILFLDYPIESSIYLYFFCITIHCFDNFFLNDILNKVLYKFEKINRHLQRQIYSVDLFKIFPLTKMDKIKTIREDEITFNIRQIQELSYFHYDLVHLALEIVGNFEITIIAALIMWFQNIIEANYYIIYGLVKDGLNFVDFLCNLLYLMYLYCWIFVLIRIFSSVKDKANETATYVHEIWNKYAIKGEIDNRIRYLQLVSVSLLNTKLQFTAMDLFPLDWTFLHMVGTYKTVDVGWFIFLFVFLDSCSIYYLRRDTHSILHLKCTVGCKKIEYIKFSIV
jgi:hypothetical protein